MKKVSNVFPKVKLILTKPNEILCIVGLKTSSSASKLKVFKVLFCDNNIQYVELEVQGDGRLKSFSDAIYFKEQDLVLLATGRGIGSFHLNSLYISDEKAITKYIKTVSAKFNTIQCIKFLNQNQIFIVRSLCFF